ncbi:MAG: primosomal replication protein N [Burkholderiales bacterium]|nr:primosomal replication protein N [Burkholderiales bacterium]
MNRANELVIAGELAERDALRHTPAGVALVNFRIVHASRQIEAGTERQVYAEIACVAAEDEARLVAAAPLGAAVRLCGFVAGKGLAGARSGSTGDAKVGARSARQLVLHVTRIEFEERERDRPAPPRTAGAHPDDKGT